jgi:hypothetical protein
MKAKVTALTTTTLTVDEVLNNTNFVWVDGSRIVNLGATALTVYSDDASAESITNPITTDSAGYAYCYVAVESVDFLVSGTGITTTLMADHATISPNTVKSNKVDGATAVAFTVDTENAWSTPGAKLLSLGTGGTEKFYVDKDGDLWTDSGVFVSDVADSATADAFVLDADNAFTTAGAKLLSLTNNSVEKFFVDKDGDISAVSGAIVLDNAANSIAAGGLTITAGGLVVGSGGIDLNGGDVTITEDIAECRRIHMNQGTALVTGDLTISAEWGDTATKALWSGSNDQRGRLSITANGSGITDDPTVTVTYTDGVFDNATVVIVTRGDVAAPDTARWSIVAQAANLFTAKFVGLPVAGNTYFLYWISMG